MNQIVHSCPDVGVWRTWLDQEDPSPALADHLAKCAGCHRLAADLRLEAADAHDAFALLGPPSLPTPADTALARERLDRRRQHAIPAPVPIGARQPSPMFLKRISTPWRLAASGLAAAVALSLLVAFTPEGQSAAAAFLSQFRSQSVAAVELTPQSQNEILRTLTGLGNLGTVKMPGASGQPRPETVARAAAEQTRTVTLAEASAAVGFSLATPDPNALPTGIDKTPRVQVMPASQVRFTFDKAKTAAYLQSTGHPNVNLPDKYDGTTLVVSIPSAALVQYSSAGSREALVIGQAGELVVEVEGGTVSLGELRDFLLGLPGLPDAVVRQLRQIQSWNDTLPIPIPIDKVNWEATSFQGNQGLLLNDNSGVGSAAIWHANGHLFGVAGSLRATDLHAIAETLKVRN
jgi:hypothetical protein